jgi:hypothetical protein
MSPAMALLRFVVLSAPVGVLVFLWTSDFFTRWDGRAVSVRPPQGEDPATMRVLIAEEGRAFERQWPSEVVRELGLPVDAMAIPPRIPEEERPKTTKRRFALHFLVDSPTGFQAVPTTSPASLALALLVWGGLVALRNMRVGGAPWATEARAAYLPKALPPSGQPTAQGGGARPKKTHPTSSRRGRR